MDYSTKSYGRNSEVEAILKLFSAGKDISKHGPRRLGKTFVLDRLVERGPKHGYKCVKIEIAGCRNSQMVFQRICEEINEHRTISARTGSFVYQRLAQTLSPRSNPTGTWYQNIISLDWEAHLERILKTISKEKNSKWAILIDELPIFLKALHDKGPEGIKEARDFMNLFSSLRSKNKEVRWLVTGSIGIDPLARKGEYVGVMAKFYSYRLPTLTHNQSVDYIQDMARLELLPYRTEITTEEAHAIIETVGWRSAYYLEALASKMEGNPSSDPIKVQASISNAINNLILPHNLSTFGTWEEHIAKHYSANEQEFCFSILNNLATAPLGMSANDLAAQLQQTITTAILTDALELLVSDGFIFKDESLEGNPYRFRIALLRLWWAKYPAKRHA